MLGNIWHQIWSEAFLIGVIGNLTASVVCLVLAVLHLERLMKRHHREHMEHLRLLHKRIGGILDEREKEVTTNALQGQTTGRVG